MKCPINTHLHHSENFKANLDFFVVVAEMTASMPLFPVYLQTGWLSSPSVTVL